MSWDGYIDSIINGSQGSCDSKQCDKAAIIALVGGVPWTTSAHPANINLFGSEGSDIASVMANLDTTLFETKGILLEKVKYQFLRLDEKTVYGKKKDHGCITIEKTKSAIIIAHTKEGGQQGETNKSVEAVVNYLENMNM